MERYLFIQDSEEITLTRGELKRLLNIATGNVKDYVMDNDGFIDEHLPSPPNERKEQ